MNIQQEADRIQRMNLKSKAAGEVVIKKLEKRNGASFANEVKQELKKRYRTKS